MHNLSIGARELVLFAENDYPLYNQTMALAKNLATKKARGDVRRGAAFFQTICAVCHGFDGKTMNFGDEKEPEYVGTVARKNPWEALHKIRFGQPGVGMVALTVLDIQDHLDILAYTQTLPVK